MYFSFFLKILFREREAQAEGGAEGVEKRESQANSMLSTSPT